MNRRVAPVLAALWLCAANASAQWLNYPDPRIPRTADGKPNLNAPAPRLPDGHVDISGMWYPDFGRSDPTSTPQTTGEDPVVRLSAADGRPPFRPGVEEAWRNLGPISPVAACVSHGAVSGLLVPSPFKIVHTTGLTILLLEELMQFRQIFTDGRPFPADMQPAWKGYSIGRWIGDEFIVETRGFNDRSRSGGLVGGPAVKNSETMHITERYRRPAFGVLVLEVTFDDPQSFSRSWTTRPVWFRLLPDTDFIENICDNEKDVERIKAADVQPGSAAR
jgi:hypothetical protein